MEEVARKGSLPSHRGFVRAFFLESSWSEIYPEHSDLPRTQQLCAAPRLLPPSSHDPAETQMCTSGPKSPLPWGGAKRAPVPALLLMPCTEGWGSGGPQGRWLTHSPHGTPSFGHQGKHTFRVDVCSVKSRATELGTSWEAQRVQRQRAGPPALHSGAEDDHVWPVPRRPWASTSCGSLVLGAVQKRKQEREFQQAGLVLPKLSPASETVGLLESDQGPGNTRGS